MKPNQKKHWLLFYEGVDDYINVRRPFRDDHLGHVRAAVDRGDIVHAGALGEPPHGSVLSFVGDTAAVAEEFARNDPYVTGGAVKQWRVERWTVVVGEGAEQI